MNINEKKKYIIIYYEFLTTFLWSIGFVYPRWISTASVSFRTDVLQEAVHPKRALILHLLWFRTIFGDKITLKKSVKYYVTLTDFGSALWSLPSTWITDCPRLPHGSALAS